MLSRAYEQNHTRLLGHVGLGSHKPTPTPPRTTYVALFGNHASFAILHPIIINQVQPCFMRVSYSIIVNSPRPIQNLAFSWGGVPRKVAPTSAWMLYEWTDV
jgi:hypothetical protein